MNGLKNLTLLRKAARRFGWGVADQAISSLTNFLLAVVIARALGPTEFGAFNLAFTAYLVSMGVSRALTTEPLAVRFSTCSEREWRTGVTEATGTAAVVAFVSGAACLLVGALAEGPISDAFVPLGVVMPGLLLQDCWRLAFFPANKGKAAFTNDLIWGVVLFAALLVVVTRAENVLAWGTFVWGLSAGVAAAAGAFHSRALPRIAGVSRWWRAQRDLASRFVLQSVVYASAGQFVYWGIAAVAGLAAVGALRAGLILLGPLNMVFTGLALVAVPEGARMLLEGTTRLRRLCRDLSVFLGLIALGWGMVAFFLPSSIGTAVLGANWEAGHDVIVPLTVMMTSIGIATGPMTGLRALGAANSILQVGIVVAVLNLAGALVGTYLDGAFGAACGMGFANAAGAFAGWRELDRAARRKESESFLEGQSPEGPSSPAARPPPP